MTDNMQAALSKLWHIAKLDLSYMLKMTRPVNLPYHYSIEATNKCNFRCASCPQSSAAHGTGRKQGYLSASGYAAYLSMIKDIRAGSRNVSICLDGEPLMNREFPTFISIANEKGFFPRFASNGRLLTKSVVDNLADNSYLASVDFTPDERLFETIRGRAGDHKIVLENLRYLVKKASVNPAIKVEMADISHFGRGKPDDAAVDRLRRLFPNDAPPNIKFLTRQFHNFTGHLKGKNADPDSYVLCPYPWTQFNVTWDGDVVACCRDTSGKTVLGNIFRNSIPEIWWGSEYAELRRALKEKRPHDVKACADCDMPWSAGEPRWKARYVLSSLLRR